MADPIHEEDGKWFFWDETWSDRHGPYDTKKEAVLRLNEYVIILDGGTP